jgi:hypothetical protein
MIESSGGRRLLVQVSCADAANSHKPQEGMSVRGQGGEGLVGSTIGFKKPRLQPVGSARADADADELLALRYPLNSGLNNSDELPYSKSVCDER